jgi:fucose permease
MSQMEVGILFCISAACFFAFGLTISGIIIDKWGVNNSLMFGLSLYAFVKFILIFADAKA